VRITFNYPQIAPFEVEDEGLVGVFAPREPVERINEAAALERGLTDPIGASPLAQLARGHRRVLILVDDLTRRTPMRLLLPPILAELNAAGIPDHAITALIALGTHRSMTRNEIEHRFGSEVCTRISIHNHAWNNPTMLVNAGHSPFGVPLRVNRLVREADFVIGVGHIVPHSVAGFSGGSKIVVPGIAGEETTAATHWAFVHQDMGRLFGQRDNPIRETMDDVARAVGLDYIINAVQDSRGVLRWVVAGDLVVAHRRGCELCREIYEVPMPGDNDITVVEAAPTDIDLRQSIKGLCAAELVTRPGGAIILVSPCPEGVAPQFPEYLEYGFRNPARLMHLAEAGVIPSKVGAMTMVYVARILERFRGYLVSPGLSREETEQMNFRHAATVQQALAAARAETGPSPRIAVIRYGGEILPLVQRGD